MVYLGVTMYKNLLIVFFAFACFLNFGCGDKGDEPCGIYTSEPLPAGYSPFRYQSGTYWVYQEVNTNDLDSIWVASVTLDTIRLTTGFGSGCDKSFADTESHIMKMEGNRYGDLYSWYLHSGGIDWGGPEHRDSGWGGNILTYGLRIYYATDGSYSTSSNPSNELSPDNSLLAYHDSLNVSGQVFTEVTAFRAETVEFFDFLPQPTAWDTYWTEDGIIRWDVRDELDNIVESWELVRWNIVR